MAIIKVRNVNLGHKLSYILLAKISNDRFGLNTLQTDVFFMKESFIQQIHSVEKDGLPGKRWYAFHRPHKWLSMSDMYLMTMILKTSFLCVAAFTFLFPRSINLMLMGHLYLNKM